MKIQHFAVIAQGLKAMGKAFRDNECPVIIGAQYLGVPVQEGRRIIAQIHSNIKDLALEARNKFHLCVGWMLEMQATDGAPFCGKCVIDLNNCLFGQNRSQFFCAE